MAVNTVDTQESHLVIKSRVRVTYRNEKTECVTGSIIAELPETRSRILAVRLDNGEIISVNRRHLISSSTPSL